MKNRLKKILAVIFAATICFAAYGCGGANNGGDGGNDKPDDPKTNVTVTLDKTSYEAKEDEIFSLVVTVTPARSVRWSSSEPKIASVSSKGKVIAKREGSATITAEADGVKATCLVTVTASDADGADVYIKTAEQTYLVAKNDEPAPIGASLVRFDGEKETVVDGATFKYESTDESVATVSEDGKITAVAEGTADVIISAKGYTEYVSADIYTASVSTPEEWLAMFKEDFRFNDRYYLKNDIDFQGEEYALGRDNNTFCSEVNGNYHTVKNITSWRDKRYNDPSMDAFQSIFGITVIGIKAKNLTFENIRFTKTNCALISDNYYSHESIVNDKGETERTVQHETYISNIRASVVYGANSGRGLCSTLIGGSAENVFLELKRADGRAFDKNFGIIERDYLSWGLGSCTLNKVIVFANGAPVWVKYPSSSSVKLADSYLSATRQDAVYRAFVTFDKAVWELSETELPVLRGYSK